jgi:hypothetical protein
LKLILSEVIFKIAEILLWEKLAAYKTPDIKNYCTYPPGQIIVFEPFEFFAVF